MKFDVLGKQFSLAGWALYISQIWQDAYEDKRNPKKLRLYAKARSIVIFDRVITGRYTEEKQ